MLVLIAQQKANFKSHKVSATAGTVGINATIRVGDMMSKNRNQLRLGVCGAPFVGAVLVSAVASADDAALRFKGGIGVIPVSAFVNCPATNPCAIPGPGPNLLLLIVISFGEYLLPGKSGSSTTLMRGSAPKAISSFAERD